MQNGVSYAVFFNPCKRKNFCVVKLLGFLKVEQMSQKGTLPECHMFFIPRLFGHYFKRKR